VVLGLIEDYILATLRLQSSHVKKKYLPTLIEFQDEVFGIGLNIKRSKPSVNGL
jgi:hypothetical protein